MLTLGNVNFGLGVDTKALQTAVDQIRAFGAAVDRVANSNAKGARKLESDLRAQEKAMTSTLQQVANMRQQLRKAKAPDNLTADLEKGLDGFIKLLDRGKVKPLEFQRAMTQMNATLQASRRGLKEHQQAMRGLGENISPITRALQAMAQAAVLVTGPLGGIAARITTLSQAFARGGVGLAALVTGLAAGSYAFAKIATAAARTAIQFDKVNALLKIVSGTSVEAAKQFDRIKDLALRTGSNIGSLATQYARMRQAVSGTSLEGEKFTQIFDGITLASAKFQLTTEETEGVLRAFEQIISKGTVQAEELRGQLGDRLVGAFQVAAQAMGKTTEQLNAMLKAGELTSTEFLPKFVKALLQSLGMDGSESVETLQAAINNLGTSIELFNNKVNVTLGIGEAFRNTLTAATNAIVFMTDNLTNIIGVLGGVAAGFMVIFAGPIIGGLGTLIRIILQLAAAVWTMNAAVLANPFGALASVLLRVGLVAAGATAGFMIMKTALGEAAVGVNSLTQEVDEYIKVTQLANRTKADQTDDYIRRVGEEKKALEDLMNTEGKRIDTLKPKVQEDAFAGVGALPFDMGGTSKKSQLDALQKSYDDAALASMKLHMQEIKLKELRIQQSKEIMKQADAYRAAQRIAVMSLDNQIHRAKAMAAANREGTGTAQALENAYSRLDAIEEFTKDLKEVEKDQHKVNKKVKEFTKVMNDLDASKGVQTMKEYSITLKEISARVEAMRQGPAELSMVDKILGDTAALRDWKERLIEAGASAAEVEAKIIALAEAMDLMRNTERDVDIAKTLRESNRELATMRGELAAMASGPAALEQFQRMNEVNTKVEDMARKFHESGMSIDLARAKATEYGNVLREHVNASALQGHLQALYDMQDQIKVFGEAADLVQKYNLSFDDAQDVSNFAVALRKLGLEQEAVNAYVAKFIELRKQSNAAQAEFEGMRQAMEGIQDAWSSAFDGMGTAITDSLFEGKNLMESMASVAKNLGKELVNMFLQLAIINPLKNAVLNPSTPYPTVTPNGGWFGMGNKAGETATTGGGLLAKGSSALNPAYVNVVNAGVLGAGAGAATTDISSAVERGLSPALAQTTTATESVNDTLIKQLPKLDPLGVFGNTQTSFPAAGTTAGGIPLAKVTDLASGMSAKVSAQYADRFQGLFNDLDKAGYKITSLGEGGYSYRNVAGTGNLSRHAFGEAIDINPRQNPYAYGAQGNWGEYGIDPSALAKKWGMTHGGDWRKADQMHFQVDRNAQPGVGAFTGDVSAFGGGQNPNASMTALNESVTQLKGNMDATSSSFSQVQTASRAVATADQAKQAAAQTAAVADQQKSITGQQAAVADQQKAITGQTAAASQTALGTSASTAATQVTSLGTASSTAAATTAAGGAGGGGLGGMFTGIFGGIGKMFTGLIGGLGSIFKGLFSGIGSIFGGLFGGMGFAKGGAWSNGVRYARKGALLTGPTMFGTSSGPVVGGEAGTEAILPLKRDAQGNLGVSAEGGGKSIVFNQNIYARDMKSAQQSRHQAAANGYRILRRGAKFA